MNGTGTGAPHAVVAQQLRADAARNWTQIREAAIAAFHGRGLGTPIDQIAAAAGVSKATVYNRFGGRRGLIDAVIDELIAADVHSAIAAARSASDAWVGLTLWVRARRDLQYREPAFTDVMLMTEPWPGPLADLAAAASYTAALVIQRALHDGVLRPDTTPADLFWADIANGLALRTLRKPDPEDYARRTDQFLEGLRAR